MNNHFFKSVQITNFKSLKDVTLSDCKRINLLIGKPNVGKSNILEAIGLFGLNDDFKLNDFIRVDSLVELFFEGNTKEEIGIKTNDYSIYLSLKKNIKELSQDLHCLISKQNLDNPLLGDYTIVDIEVDDKLYISMYYNDELFEDNVKQYKFISNFDYHSQNITNLISPFGGNLFNIIQTLPNLKKEISNLFSDYGLKLVFDKTSDSLKVMKEISGGAVFLLPYHSIADTLQRVIFFKTAIASNKDSILLFEEPEAHCFPPYIAHFTQDVINSTSNQFFIATHSPYVLNDFLETEETRKELAIFIADFKDGQTVINRLTDDEVNEVYDYGIDVFFNYERFTRHDG
ncbi:MAG: AAA family ATPase [Methylococcales bacterium]|nr:AAA family ATPase [Methylococcales bacterium]MDP3838923.1 AAA family ATPase [Methylococcales bacterium]